MILAIDIGGTKTLLALFSDGGRVMKRLKFSTDQNPEKFIKILMKNLREMMPGARVYTISAAVVAIAATVDSAYNVNEPTLATTFGRPLAYGNLKWDGFEFTAKVEDCIKKLFKENRCKLPKSTPKASILCGAITCCPIRIMNDANLATIYECRKMKGRSVYLTFSTGIGGGICDDGKLNFKKSDPFEPGHHLYTWQGKKIEYEDIASANALKEAYGLRATDLKGMEAYQDIAVRVSTGLADIIKAMKPDTIVVGGALGFQLRNFRKYLLPILAVSLNTDSSNLPKIVAAKYPLESVIYGCYMCGKEMSE
ncbi:MAG: ROK family protein [Candidatus Saccharibacteria bacterium]|nr:ROK family protein [Candidatus Saccharibacteria bacterium]